MEREERSRLVVAEAMRALRLSRRYRGRFSQDEFEAAKLILGVRP